MSIERNIASDKLKFRFTGNSFVKIDKTLRVTVPSAFMETLENIYAEEPKKCVWLVPGILGLRVLPQPAWEDYLDELERNSDTNEGLEIKQYFLSRSQECELDAQNRIRLPEYAMELGRLNLGEVAFSGAGVEMLIQNASAFRCTNTTDHLAMMIRKQDEQSRSKRL